MNIQVDGTSSNLASATLNSKIGPRAVVGYGVKTFHPSPVPVKFYALKVANLKMTKPSQWWRDVKMIAGMTPATGGDDIRSHLLLDEITTHSNQDIASMINTALLEPMQDYAPLPSLPLPADDAEVLTITQSEVCNALLVLNPRKAGGPDGINNWLLRDYADFLL